PPSSPAERSHPPASAKADAEAALPMKPLRKWGFRTAVDGIGSFAFAPEPLPGLGISGGIRMNLSQARGLSLALEGRTLFPIRQSIRNGWDVRVRPMLGMLAPCYHESWLAICLPLAAGAVEIIGNR